MPTLDWIGKQAVVNHHREVPTRGAAVALSFVLILTTWAGRAAARCGADFSMLGGPPNKLAGIYIRDNDWFKISSGNNICSFFRKPISPNTGDIRRLWVRFEYPVPKRDEHPYYRSTMDLDEFDCAQGRIRIIQETRYSKNNLQGSPSVPLTAGSSWIYAGPGTIDEQLYVTACGVK